jgi:SET domain-containing protein
VFNKGDLIGQYVGEFINNDESNIREEFRDIEKTTYMFALYDNYTIDSRYMGNNLRFANHSKNKQNARAEIVFENGKHKICLFALKDIKYDEEIFFDYDGQHKLSSKFEWIEDKPKSKKKLKMIKSANKENEDDLLKKKKNRNDFDDEEFDEFSDESSYNNNINNNKKKKFKILKYSFLGILLFNIF